MTATAAMEHSLTIQGQALTTYQGIEDEASARATAQELGFLAYQLEQIADRLEVTGPPPVSEQLRITSERFGEIFAQGMGAIGPALQLLSKPELLVILQPAHDRYEQALERLKASIGAPPR